MATFRSKYRGLILEDADGVWARFEPARDPVTGAPLPYGQCTTDDESAIARLRAAEDVDEVLDQAEGDDAATDQGTPPDPDAAAALLPPLHGKGSGRAEWAAYATALGLEVHEDDARDTIVAAVKAAGHPIG